jgi:hypothetical protein
MDSDHLSLRERLHGSGELCPHGLLDVAAHVFDELGSPVGDEMALPFEHRVGHRHGDNVVADRRASAALPAACVLAHDPRH